MPGAVSPQARVASVRSALAVSLPGDRHDAGRQRVDIARYQVRRPRSAAAPYGRCRHRRRARCARPCAAPIRSWTLSFARSSRDGEMSIASIVGDRSMAIASAAVSSTKGGRSRSPGRPGRGKRAERDQRPPSDGSGRNRLVPIAVRPPDDRAGRARSCLCHRRLTSPRRRAARQRATARDRHAEQPPGPRKWKSAIIAPASVAAPARARSAATWRRDRQMRKQDQPRSRADSGRARSRGRQDSVFWLAGVIWSSVA